MKFRLGFVAVPLALTLIFAAVSFTPAHADNLYAQIRGTVVDPSGAVVPDARVIATNQGTGISYSANSTKDGLFEFLQLPIGDYAVRAEKSGFKTFSASGIHLNLDQTYNLKVAMELGTTSETVTVEANSAQVETTSMQLGTTITSNQIVDIPLNGRNWTQLQQLEPGVEATSDRFGTYSTNGAETQQNAFLINGTDTNDTSLNVPLVIPSPDAIGEFNMVSSTINPEYGRNSGAIINATIKSGTNQFHGDVFEFYRDTFLDAKSWFEPTATPFHQNQFGGVIGGPIIKDHAFFFFSYQGTRNTSPQAYVNGVAPTVFSPAERTGDFSELSSFYNSGNPEPAGSPCGPGYAGPFGPNPVPFAIGGIAAGTPWCAAFPTGTLPTASLNPLAVKLMNQYVPLPNAAGNLYQFNPTERNGDDQFLGRIDEKVSNSDAVWFYGLRENYPTAFNTLPFVGASLPGFASNNPAWYNEYTAAWNHTFSPTTLNELRFAYLRFNFVAVQPENLVNPTAYGFTGITPQTSQFDSLPVMNLSGLFSIGFSSDGPQPRVQNTYQVTDNFSKVWGHHTFKLGFNMDRLEINNPFYPNLYGTYSYSGAGLFSTGNPGADFLMGVPDSYSQGSGTIIRARGREYYSYGQDQWQVRPDLTLTLGVSWDIETPYKNLFAGGEVMSQFIAGEQSKIFPNAPVGIVFPGDPGVNQYGGPTVHYGDFAPRLGFAWSPSGSHDWSIRGGVGLYYNRTEEELTLQTLANPPFAAATLGAGQVGGAPAFANPYYSVNATALTTPSGYVPPVVCPTCATSVANIFPFTPPTPGSTNINWSQFEPIGFDMNTEDPRMTAPRSTNYNLNVQYQVSKSTIVQLGYVGNVARHLEGAYNLNPAGQYPGVNPGALALGCDSDFGLATCAPGTFPYNPSVYGQIGRQVTDYSSNYNSLQASINRHFTNGLQFQAAYTWSRYFDYTSNLENSSFNGPGINVFAPSQNYGPSANDAPQRLVINYTYTMPFYRLTHRLRPLTDDWTLSGITTFQSGFPVQVFSLGYDDLQAAAGYGYYAPPDHAQSVPGQALDENHNPRHALSQGLPGNWINPNAFTTNAPGTIGNANRNPFYGPGLNYWDMALEKGIHFTESKMLQLRFETFDTFNHANFSAPYAYVGTAIFGQILGTQQISTNGDGRVVQLAAKFMF
jgi:hypothetical protein